MYRPVRTLTANNAKAALDAGQQAIAAGQTHIDLGDLTVVDSAAVATLLAWQRSARGFHAELIFSNIPANLQSLINLYGVADLLHPVSSSAPHVDLLRR
jgi:phospholipid transport system transporter-binding protein